MLGPYCHHCGEQAFKRSDLSVKKLFRDGWSSWAEMDGRFVRSFWLLISQPGRLTSDYLLGKRKPRLSPIHLLIWTNVLFFLSVSLVGQSPYTTQLKFHLEATNFIHQSVAQEWVTERLQSSGESLATYAERFNTVAEVQAKSLVMLMVPMIALLVWGMYRRHNAAAIAAWVFATHLFAFMLLFQAVVLPLMIPVLGWLSALNVVKLNGFVLELVYSLSIAAVFGWYFYLSGRRVYQPKVWINIVKTVVYVFALYWITLLYRMVLFFTAFYFT